VLKRWVAALGLAIGLLLVTFNVFAAGSGPLILFTANIHSTGTSEAVTPMEQALLDRLDAATVSIDAAIYDLNRISIRDALIAAHGRGVAVRVVTDNETYHATYGNEYDELEAAGITVVDDGRSSIMHNKFFIIDGELVWAGSTNMSNTGFTFNHNNSVVMTSTVLADIYTLEFEEMVGGKFGTAKTDNTPHSLDYNGIPVEVYFSPTDGAMDQVIAQVNAAAESIHFSIFFFTDNNLRDAMLARAQHGVTISGIWDLLGASNLYSEDEALCDAGVPIKIEDFGGKMHNKFMVVDANGASPRVITGSMNWSRAGGSANDENTLIIHDGETAQQYLAAYEELWDALGDHTLCIATAGQDFAVFVPLVLQLQLTPPPAGSVVITDIFYDGVKGSAEPDEYVEIRNSGNAAVQLQGWTLMDEAEHTFVFPAFLMQPGQTCRVYTNEDHPEWCGFSYGRGSAIWNNDGDCAYLRDSGGVLVDSYCYP
jgi:phosphatidylserine/phosphatidylglycerophosphate/cardiolipin synthase-like enzyme